MNKIFTLCCIIWGLNLTFAQTITDEINYDYNIEKYNKVRIHNYNGNVKVNVKPGNKLSIKGVRTLKSGNNTQLTSAKQEIYLDTTVIDGEFIVFMVAPNKYFKMDDEGGSYYKGEDWNNWSKRNIKEYGVEYEFEIEAIMPADKELYVATHRKDVIVSGVENKTTVMSHHGSVEVTTGSDVIYAKSHHGDVTVNHSSGNVKEGIYKTHHGDIHTTFPVLSAVVTLDSYHGSQYIDFEYSHVAQQVKLDKDGNKTKYKYGGETQIKVGNGNGTLSYSTHHGDTFINKKK